MYIPSTLQIDHLFNFASDIKFLFQIHSKVSGRCECHSVVTIVVQILW